MKKIVYILILSVLTLTGVVSCDVMDQYPHNAVSREQITEEDLGLLHVGLYNYMQHKPSFTGYFQPEMAGGDFVRGGGCSSFCRYFYYRSYLDPLIPSGIFASMTLSVSLMLAFLWSLSFVLPICS